MTSASIPRTLEWTAEARLCLETWLAQRTAAAANDGASPEDVSEGLRAHVHEELLRRSVNSVDEPTLRAVLATIDGPGPCTETPRPRAAGFAHRSRRIGWPKTFLAFAVILPALTWLAEWAFGLCASEFFDPLPTLWHVALVGMVPASLWFAHRTVQAQNAAHAGRAALLTGMALVVAAFYSFAFGPLLLVAFMGTIFCLAMPWFLPLPWMTLAAPLAVIASFFALRRLRALAPCGRRWFTGVLLGGALVVGGEAPRWMTLDAMVRAAKASEPSEQAAALSRLRWLPGAHDMLHAACFGEGRNRAGAVDITSWMASAMESKFERAGSAHLSMEEARSVYYRVTGRAFTDVRPRGAGRPDIFNMRLGVGRAARTDWVWDGERGGASVGARLPGLTVASSRMEWHAEPAARLAYGEWTLEFANAHANAQEARAQVLLPPGACVSRLTLWVNGEPQEAAFAAQSAVRAAYQKVVTVERRDPVLVTQVGPDTVMMQCFPVPANGGTMKVRLGITAPFDARGQLVLPQLTERNFSLPASLRHVVWVQSRGPFDASPAGTVEKTESGAQTWQQDVPNDEVSAAKFTWQPSAPAPLWCEDTLAMDGEPRFVTAQWETPPDAPPAAVAVVIDGSLSLRPLRGAIVRALQAKNGNASLAAWISTDLGPRQLDLSLPDAGLKDDDFSGGRDGLDALRAALSWTRSQSGTGAVLWLHGPQPAEFGSTAALEQMLQFSLRHVPILDVPLVAGAHRLTEKLYRRSDLRGTPRLGDPAETLPEFFAAILAGRQEPTLKTGRQAEAPTTGTKTSDQLSRYASYLHALGSYRSTGPDSLDAGVIASTARHQIVSPFTGAVVLENNRQYDENGLSQVDPSSVPKVPTIPEPGAATLLLAAAALTLRRRR